MWISFCDVPHAPHAYVAALRTRTSHPRTHTSLRSARVLPLATIIGRSWVSLRCRTTASHVVRPLHSCRVHYSRGRFAALMARVTATHSRFSSPHGVRVVSFGAMLTHGRSVARTSPRSIAARYAPHCTPRTYPVRRRRLAYAASAAWLRFARLACGSADALAAHPRIAQTLHTPPLRGGVCARCASRPFGVTPKNRLRLFLACHHRRLLGRSPWGCYRRFAALRCVPHPHVSLMRYTSWQTAKRHRRV